MLGNVDLESETEFSTPAKFQMALVYCDYQSNVIWVSLRTLTTKYNRNDLGNSNLTFVFQRSFRREIPVEVPCARRNAGAHQASRDIFPQDTQAHELISLVSNK